MNKLNSNTLVLNRGWLAVQVCSVKRAISLLYQGHAKVIDDNMQAHTFNEWVKLCERKNNLDDKEIIHTPTKKLLIPRVIVLLFYDRLPRREVRFSRNNIFERDTYTCQYCGLKPHSQDEGRYWLRKNKLNMDHIIPKSRGGKTSWDNVVLSCYKCNSKKGNHLLEELGWKLLKKPEAPTWAPTISVFYGIKPHKQWLNFLNLEFWNRKLEEDNNETVCS